MSEPSGPGLEAVAGTPDVYLNLENITGSGKPVKYAVYLNVPDGDDPADHPELFVGILPMFGLAETSRRDAEHAGSGLHYTLDITPVVRRLQQQNAWNPESVRVAFVPRRRGSELEAPAQPIQVGRVSIYVG
jgi:tyrosinase